MPRWLQKPADFATISSQMTRPQTTEAAPYYFKYIDLITSEEIVPAIHAQKNETLKFLEGISEEQSLYSYAPGKWTIREVLNHVNDGERVFLGRAFWFARGFQDPLPSFDQDLSVQAAQANQTSWAQLVAEFRTVREATISFFDTLPVEAWSRTGVASDNPVSVRALAYIIAGHVAHHTNVLKEKYRIS
jgi:uncharacterized damage-inducible protein DinB